VDAPLDDTRRPRWDQERVERALSGDQAAFGELYDAYAASLYRRVLLPMLGNASAAEDALSETFRSAYQHLDAYRPTGLGVYPWLAKIAKNKALDMFRARKVTGRALANFEALLEPVLPRPASPEQLLNEELSQRRLSQGIRHTLGQLNERYRTVIELRFFEEQPREVCAEKLGVKLGTFDVLLLRALRAFRKHWEEQHATGALSHE
jgi:RNA polymerase sigma factor (sigma-70 family)